MLDKGGTWKWMYKDESQGKKIGKIGESIDEGTKNTLKLGIETWKRIEECTPQKVRWGRRRNEFFLTEDNIIGELTYDMQGTHLKTRKDTHGLPVWSATSVVRVKRTCERVNEI